MWKKQSEVINAQKSPNLTPKANSESIFPTSTISISQQKNKKQEKKKKQKRNENNIL